MLITYRYGVIEILVGQIIISFINYIPNSYFSSRLLGYGVAEQVKDFGPILMAASLAALCGYLFIGISDINLILEILVSGLMMSLIYFIILFLIDRKTISQAFQFARGILTRNK